MIKFFRNIRRKMLVEGKTGKYFKYAIGEIVLVVIGILIALQVNGWKEDRQAAKYEHKILEESLNQLKEDGTRFKGTLKDLKVSVKSLHYLIDYVNSDATETDSLDYHLQNLRFKNFMVYNKSAYESLKSGGLERVTNDSIRNALTQLYETGFPAGEFMINKIISGNMGQLEDDYQNLFLDGFYVTDTGTIGDRSIAVTNDLLKTEAFALILKRAVGVIPELEFSYERILIPSIEQLIQMIEKELDKT